MFTKKTKVFFRVVREAVDGYEGFREFIAKHPSLRDEWEKLSVNSELFNKLEILMKARDRLRQAVHTSPRLARDYLNSLPLSISHPVLVWMSKFLEEMNSRRTIIEFVSDPLAGDPILERNR